VPKHEAICDERLNRRGNKISHAQKKEFSKANKKMKRISWIALLLLLAILAVASQAQTDNNAQSIIWNMYRHELTRVLSKQYCGGAANCAALDSTVFQFVDTPMDALWHKSRVHVCFAPKR